MLGRQYDKTIYRTNPYNLEFDNVEVKKLNTMQKIEWGLVGMGSNKKRGWVKASEATTRSPWR